MDQLTGLLRYFSLHTGIFYAGNICGSHRFAADEQRGHLHLVRRGPVRITGIRPETLRIDEPTLVFLPRPGTHRLVAGKAPGADVICGTVQFGAGGRSAISDSLPELLLVNLQEIPELDTLLSLLFEEAFSMRPGKQAVLDRLAEVLIIGLLRFCIDSGRTNGGTLAGLTDARLARALEAMHEQPSHPWQVTDLAKRAGMSRARFAARFHAVTGTSPMGYLTDWRLALAQRQLQRGEPLQRIAQEVGYGSSSALSRVFSRTLGLSPTDWKRRNGRLPQEGDPKGDGGSTD